MLKWKDQRGTCSHKPNYMDGAHNIVSNLDMEITQLLWSEKHENIHMIMLIIISNNIQLWKQEKNKTIASIVKDTEQRESIGAPPNRSHVA